MNTIYLHFPDGTYKAIESTTGRQESGYIPSRKDKLITAHIITQDGYELFIDTYTLTLKYKYITLNYSRFTIGRTNYPINALDTFSGSELPHLTRLRELRDEILQYRTVDGLPISYRCDVIVSNMVIIK